MMQLARNPRLWRGGQPPADAEQIDDLVLWVTLGVILGGRLGYVLFYAPELIWREPIEILRVWHGGMSFHGGVLGVTLALIFFARTHKMPFLSLTDLVAPAAPIGLFFGRIANFINGELWGRPTSLPWGMIFPAGGPQPRHPSQIYEAALEGLLLGLLLIIAVRQGALKRPWLVSGLFGIGYGLARIASEFFREPDQQLGFLLGGATMGMLLSVPLVLLGLALAIHALRKPPASTPPESPIA